jgi:hypothetical protein
MRNRQGMDARGSGGVIAPPGPAETRPLRSAKPADGRLPALVREVSKIEEIRGLEAWSFRARLWAIRRLQRAWALNPAGPVK